MAPSAVDEPAEGTDGRGEAPGAWTLQFTLAGLMILTFVLAIVFAVLFAVPDTLAAGVLLVDFLTLPALLTAAIVYGRDDLRAFSLGALFPATVLFVVGVCLFVIMTFEAFRGDYEDFLRNLEQSASGLRMAAVSGWILAILTGLLTVALRRWLQPAGNR